MIDFTAKPSTQSKPFLSICLYPRADSPCAFLLQRCSPTETVPPFPPCGVTYECTAGYQTTRSVVSLSGLSLRSTSLEYTRVVWQHQRANLDPMIAAVGRQRPSATLGVIRPHRVHDIYGRWMHLRTLTAAYPFPNFYWPKP